MYAAEPSGNESDLHERETLIFFFISYEGNREFHVLKATTDQYITCENAAALSIKLLPKRTALMRQFSFLCFFTCCLRLPSDAGHRKKDGIHFPDTAFFVSFGWLFLYLIIRTLNTPSTASSAFTISSVASLSRSIMV